MRVSDAKLKEIIDNGGELASGSISSLGILRLALDLQDARSRVEKPHPHHWGQANPVDQAVVIVMAIEGLLSNLEDGISTPFHTLEQLKPRLEDLKTLHRNWLEKKW